MSLRDRLIIDAPITEGTFVPTVYDGHCTEPIDWKDFNEYPIEGTVRPDVTYQLVPPIVEVIRKYVPPVTELDVKDSLGKSPYKVTERQKILVDAIIPNRSWPSETEAELTRDLITLRKIADTEAALHYNGTVETTSMNIDFWAVIDGFNIKFTCKRYCIEPKI